MSDYTLKQALADTETFLDKIGNKRPYKHRTRQIGYLIDGLFRVSLLQEELGELSAALHSQNSEKVADALGDLLYVVLGTAVLFDIPLIDVFTEIHNSNMTKRPAKDSGDLRVRDKGLAYRPPNLLAILSLYDIEKE